MPKKSTLERAKRLKQEGKAPGTQAGPFVREAMESLKEGKNGPVSKKQAVAIGLSQARRAGVDLPPPKKGRTSEKTRKSAASAHRRGQELGELRNVKASRSRSSRSTSSAATPRTRPSRRSDSRGTSKARGAK